jgi:hypothetical protein
MESAHYSQTVELWIDDTRKIYMICVARKEELPATGERNILNVATVSSWTVTVTGTPADLTVEGILRPPWNFHPTVT